MTNSSEKLSRTLHISIIGSDHSTAHEEHDIQATLWIQGWKYNQDRTYDLQRFGKNVQAIVTHMSFTEKKKMEDEQHGHKDTNSSPG